jgi:radical SAM protein with 4Fe4S-binding SPASM domain
MKINKDQFVLSKWKRLQFDYKRAKGHMFSYLKNRFYWHYIPKFHSVLSFPDHVDLEIASTCNLKCSMCYTITDEFKNRVQRMFMDFDLFKKLVDECAKNGVYSIRLSLRGEAFIHKDVVEMIKYAKQVGIKEISSLTNLYGLKPEIFEAAMKAGLSWLTISFDGLGKMYESIRRPARFEEMYDRVKEFKRIKDKHNSIKPVIKIQTLWPAIKDDPVAYYNAFDPYVDNIASNPLIDYLHNDSEDEIEYVDNFTCPVLFQRLVVGSDGKVLLCSNDEMGKYIIGDANNETLKHIWHGEKISQARKMHIEHRGHKQIPCCKECYLPRKTEPVLENFGDTKILVEKYIGRVDVIGK